MQSFNEAGYEICDINENPYIYVVNTCTVTNISDRKSRQALRKLKSENNRLIVVAVGCYAQIASKELESIKEINIILGNKEKKDIVKYVENYIQEKQIIDVSDISKQKEFDEYGIITFNDKSRTTIKIQDGCNNFCSYCAIPYARGRIRSRKKENVLKEAEEISKKGIKEIVLTGIHIASFGKDLEDNYYLIDLLEDLNKIKGIERIRLGSLEPTIITEDFVARLKKLEKVCHHFHLSLQSGCDETLKRMNRKYNTHLFKNVTNILRENFEDAILTTDIIVGFPGETEEEFKKTYDFLKKMKFYKMHIFKYSKRNGTIAALMPNQIDRNVQEQRSNRLIELSNKNQNEYNEKYLNKKLEILFEEKQEGYWTGHSKNYIMVKTHSNENLENKLRKVLIKDIKNNEIFGIVE